MNARVIIAPLFAMILCFTSFAQTSKNLSTTLDQETEYDINKQTLTLLTFSTENIKEAEAILLNSLSLYSNLNIGEQYLFLLSKANIAQYYQQHRQVISLLEQAQLLQSHIAKKQLASPLFANLNQVLATSLAATKNYEKAYQIQKSFIDDYNDYGDAQRDRIVQELTKKHEITHKIETNRLLDNQNELRALRLDDVEKQQAIQQRNFLLILCAIIVFILLFLRQLMIRRKLILLTKTDSLTGLTNRSALFIKGQELLDTSSEQQLDLSVLLFNIHDFKCMNDSFGRHVGDLVLAKVAQLVSETMRARDVFARLNGEEFVAILPSTDIGKAKAIAVRVIEKIADDDFSALGLDKNITLNIGVANNHDTTEVFDDLLHAADLAMHQARAQGQNQMVSYSTIVKDKDELFEFT